MKRLWYFLPILVVLLIVVLSIQPYLAVTESNGKGVLVAEGWMDEDSFAQVADAFKKGHYDKIVTTGTVRHFAYYLNNQEQLLLNKVLEPATLSFELQASGVQGARMAFINGQDTLFDTDLSKEPKNYHFDSNGEVIDSLRIQTYSTVSTDWNFKISIVNGLKVNGMNAHTYFGHIVHVDRLGKTTIGARTYAGSALDFLSNEGIPADKIISIPAVKCAELGRTKCNASHFALVAGINKWSKADIVSLGVHARRSWQNYSSALPEHFELGVISITDPECPRSTWFFETRGREKVFKELSAVFFGSAVDINKKKDE